MELIILTTLQTRFVLRADTNSNWSAVENTAILLKGEPAFEFFTDGTTKMKVGDGETAWKDLPYVAAGTADGEAGANGLLFENNKLYLTKAGEKISTPVEIKSSGVNGLYYNSNKLYLTTDGIVSSEPVEIVGGSGGSTGTFAITLVNKSENRIFSVTKTGTAEVKFLYRSVDTEGIGDGAGLGQLYAGGVKKLAFNVKQGENTLDITQFLEDGSQEVSIVVANSENNSKTLLYQITVLNLSIECSRTPLDIYGSTAAIQYTVRGQGNKTIHYVLDGIEYKTETVEASGISKTFELSDLQNGAHILEIFATANVDGVALESNTVKLGLIVQTDTMTDPAVVINFSGSEIMQGDTLVIPYLAYAPNASSVEAELTVYNDDAAVYSQKRITIGFTPQNWTLQDYPQGSNVKFEISVGNDSNKAAASIILKVNPSTFNQTILEDSKILEFSAAGRSNNEDAPATWQQDDVVASFSGFGWTGADGWVEDSEGITVLRFLPDDIMEIPFKPFEKDLKSSGFTIEVELATHNVRDYESIVLESYDEVGSGETTTSYGFRIRSQAATYYSQHTNTSVQFKEDSKVRICFVVEPSTLNRFIYTYINGIMCGVRQYPEGDTFIQPMPVGITIGAESCGLDLYTLRVYKKGLTRYEQLNNFICDRPTLAQRQAAYDRNNVLNSSNQVAIANLPLSIPYLILECPQLPRQKGDKKKGCSVVYVDGLNPERSFTATNVQLNVQGTSSEGYPVKNYKVDFKGGIDYTTTGGHADGWAIEPDRLISKCWCIKADYASSENANNTCLAEYYDDLIDYKTPAQQANPKVQTTVRGNPIVVFWRNTETNEIVFLGKYNANNDKSNENCFGFDRDVYPALECFEFKNNTSLRSLFKSDDFTSTHTDADGNTVYNWLDDFEARFPDLDTPYEDATALQKLFTWVVSTDRTVAGLSEAEKTARLQKFKDELSSHMKLAPLLFYYIFTEAFLMVDSRAKNLFLTTWDGNIWEPFCYDLDTAAGINNEGSLVFDYSLEDTDTVDGAAVYNGQDSVLWCNLRDAFGTELKALYQDLRSKNFSYKVISDKMAKHQSTWPEAIWNEDAYNKYLNPLLADGVNNLDMLQGDKRSQRDWWLFNRFRYLDSKYQTGDAITQYAMIRCYATAPITLTPYANIYSHIRWGGTNRLMRTNRNQSYTFECPLDQMNDTEVYIFSVDRMADLGDLSPLNIGYVDLSRATKLQRLILGSNKPGYQNTKLRAEQFSVGNNDLLTLLNVQNCIALNGSIDVSHCRGLETVLAGGSKLTGIDLPDGGHLKTLELPSTISNLTIKNQKNITNLSLEGLDALFTIWLENTPNIDIEYYINNAANLSYARLVGVEWTATSEATLTSTIAKLKACKGLAANGGIQDKAVVSGKVHISSISDALLEEINDNFPELLVIVNDVAKCFVRFVNYNNELLCRYVANEGDTIADPLASGLLTTTPVKPNTEDSHYTYVGWSETLPIVASGKPYTIVARFKGNYLVQFYSEGGLEYADARQWIEEGQDAVEPVGKGTIGKPVKESTAQYEYTFAGWNKSLINITAAVKAYPSFAQTIRKYKIAYYCDATKLEEATIQYGTTLAYSGDTSEIKRTFNGEVSPYYTFIGWLPDPSIPITGNTDYMAQFAFNGEIEDDWATIAANCKNGNISGYGYGGQKTIDYDLTVDGITQKRRVRAEIVGKNHDTLTTNDATYNGGAGKAALTFILYDLEDIVYAMNLTAKGEEANNRDYNGLGWASCDLRTTLQDVIFSALPLELQNVIKPVDKISDKGFGSTETTTTSDKLWIPSHTEIGFSAAGANTLPNQGAVYPMYPNDASRVKTNTGYCKPDGFTTTKVNVYYTRSTVTNVHHPWYGVDSRGGATQISGGNKAGLCWGFCV